MLEQCWTPFDQKNSLVKNVAYIAQTFGQRPADIFEELLNRELSPDERISLDFKSLEAIFEDQREQNAIIEGSSKENQSLKAKWRAEDYMSKMNLEQRRKDYEAR